MALLTINITFHSPPPHGSFPAPLCSLVAPLDTLASLDFPRLEAENDARALLSVCGFVWWDREKGEVERWRECEWGERDQVDKRAHIGEIGNYIQIDGWLDSMVNRMMNGLVG